MVNQNNEGDQTANLELPLFDQPTIANATNYFSSSNKIGTLSFTKNKIKCRIVRLVGIIQDYEGIIHL